MKITEKYGPDEFQEGDLYIPDTSVLATICLFHGGFWKMPYDKSQLNKVSERLSLEGYAVWNIEYRRIGYKKTDLLTIFEDAIDSINHLSVLEKKYPVINLNKVFIAGHSAGGHIALWLGKNDNKITQKNLMINPLAFIGLAPVLDLKRAFKEKAGGEAVLNFFNTATEIKHEMYECCSPIEMSNRGNKQLIIHGMADEALPIQWTRDYVELARSRGENLDYIELKNAEHMEFVDPNGIGINKLSSWIADFLKR